jgi:hypothetical protein
VGLEVIPGLKDKWSEFKYKPLILFAGFELVPIVLWALACFAGIQLYQPIDCAQQGLFGAAVTGFLGFLSTSTTYAVGTRHFKNAKTREVLTNAPAPSAFRE